jgi:hypothetical protein
MNMRIPALFGATIILGLLAGCNEIDPYRRPYTWSPTGASAGNIAAMVANPNDLIRGHGVQRSDGKESVTAVERIWTDKPKPLLDPAGGQGGQGGSGGGGGGAGGGAAAGG